MLGKVADDDGEFTAFRGLDINDSGQVVFHAWLADFGSGIFVGDGGTTRPVVTTQADSPLGKFNFLGDYPSIHNSGTVAFRAP